jgi:hypothetical protein
MLVGQEARADRLHVAQAEASDLASEPVEHRLGHIDGDHPRAIWRDRHRELPRPGAELHDDGFPRQAEILEDRDLA